MIIELQPAMMRVSMVFVTLSVLFQAAWISAKHIRGANNVGVYGGDFIRIEDAPWMAQVYTSENVPCAGTIVDRQFILTVDTCCNDRGNSLSDWKVHVGSDGRNSGGNSVKIQNAYKYTRPGEDYNLKPVLCLLKLEKPLEYSETIQQASLEEPSIVISNGTEVDFIAFGRPDILDETRGLRRAKLPIDDADWCKEENKRLGGGQICAGDHYHNACAGDAGGALTSGSYLIGVLSEATSDCHSNPSRFCRISFYRPWINETIKENE